ncbi:hypothetical protein PUN28_009404 [Cardiocondyla obscurior]|uniref:Uncharacterized protein n=1 Tax=Cardiocondyla obscurior TaxID=286306 RepID=A0AAW2FVF3_9HYME
MTTTTTTTTTTTLASATATTPRAQASAILSLLMLYPSFSEPRPCLAILVVPPPFLAQASLARHRAFSCFFHPLARSARSARSACLSPSATPPTDPPGVSYDVEPGCDVGHRNRCLRGSRRGATERNYVYAEDDGDGARDGFGEEGRGWRFFIRLKLVSPRRLLSLT